MRAGGISNRGTVLATSTIYKYSEAAETNTGNAAGIGVDTDDNRLYINKNSDGVREPINTSAVETVTATNTLTAEESGKTCFLSSATEFVTTLPAPAAGLVFDFIVVAAPSGASYTVVTNGSSNIMLGHILTCQDAGGTSDSEVSGGDTLSFVDGKAVKGDRARFISDGTSWYVSAFSKVFDGITITTAS